MIGLRSCIVVSSLLGESVFSTGCIAAPDPTDRETSSSALGERAGTTQEALLEGRTQREWTAPFLLANHCAVGRGIWSVPSTRPPPAWAAGQPTRTGFACEDDWTDIRTGGVGVEMDPGFLDVMGKVVDSDVWGVLTIDRCVGGGIYATWWEALLVSPTAFIPKNCEWKNVETHLLEPGVSLRRLIRPDNDWDYVWRAEIRGFGDRSDARAAVAAPLRRDGIEPDGHVSLAAVWTVAVGIGVSAIQRGYNNQRPPGREPLPPDESPDDPSP
jgi:hypothetical protein